MFSEEVVTIWDSLNNKSFARIDFEEKILGAKIDKNFFILVLCNEVAIYKT